MVVPAHHVKSHFHKLSIEESNRLGVSQELRARVSGLDDEAEKAYRYILPCDFNPEWTSLGAFAKYVDCKVNPAEPIESQDWDVGRSVVSQWIALTSGDVYKLKVFSFNQAIIAQKTPLHIKQEWITEAIARAQPRAQTVTESANAPKP